MWFMPIFGLLCMLIFIFIYFISRIFNRNSGCYGSFNQAHPGDSPNQDALLQEIRELRREVEELKKQAEAQEEGSESDEQSGIRGQVCLWLLPGFD